MYPQALKGATSKIINLKAHLRALVKMSIFVLSLGVYFTCTLITLPFITIFNSERVRSIVVSFVGLLSRFALWFMGVKLTLNGATTYPQGKLIVSNHLSYIDVLVIASRFPSCFVTSVEIKQTPFLGQLCSLAGCLFVERRSRDNLSKEVGALTRALKAGIDVTIFPEATSTNGESVIRFRRPLFQAAIDANVSVLPITLNYRKIDDSRVNPENRDFVFWYGDMPFLGHLWSFFMLKRVDVEMSLSKSIELSEGLDKNLLCERAYDSVFTHYSPIN